jgi:hypothetical protein
MEKQKITISTTPVTIKVIEVAGKKMTLSVFKQIPSFEWDIKDIEDEDLNQMYLGWVSHNDRKYLLLFSDNVLYKDEYEFATVPQRIRLELQTSSKYKDFDINHALYQRYLEAKKDFDWESNYAQAHNNFYKRFLEDKNQLYIAI